MVPARGFGRFRGPFAKPKTCRACMKPLPASTPLLADVRQLIDAARQRVWFDLRIVWLTFVKVLRRDGVSH